MNKVLDELYSLCFKIPEGFYERKNVVAQEKIKEKAIKELSDTLTEEQKVLLENVIDEVQKYDALESFEFFTQGTQAGFQLYEELHDTSYIKDIRKVFNTD